MQHPRSAKAPERWSFSVPAVTAPVSAVVVEIICLIDDFLFPVGMA